MWLDDADSWSDAVFLGRRGFDLEGDMVRRVVVDEMNQAGTLFLQFKGKSELRGINLEKLRGHVVNNNAGSETVCVRNYE